MKSRSHFLVGSGGPQLWAEAYDYGFRFRISRQFGVISDTLRCGVENVLLELAYVIPGIVFLIDRTTQRCLEFLKSILQNSWARWNWIAITVAASLALFS